MNQPFTEVLSKLGLDLLALGAMVAMFLFRWSPLIAWVAWWLWGVNWKKAWPILAGGAWIPLALLMLISAFAWAQMAPGQYTMGLVTVPEFLWHIGAVLLLVALALFCGWLQGVLGWMPADIDLEPPAVAHEHH